jgi:hypothetical protein
MCQNLQQPDRVMRGQQKHALSRTDRTGSKCVEQGLGRLKASGDPALNLVGDDVH